MAGFSILNKFFLSMKKIYKKKVPNSTRLGKNFFGSADDGNLRVAFLKYFPPCEFIFLGRILNNFSDLGKTQSLSL